MKKSRRLPVSEIIAGAILVFMAGLILMGLVFPAASGPDSSRWSRAKNDTTQIATAVVAYTTEYGKLPATNRGVVGGEVLATLMGSNLTLNPRKLVFLEVPPYRKGVGGLTNGVYLDPWGGTYQIAFDGDYDNRVQAGISNVVILKTVAVWTDPSLGYAPFYLSKHARARRYVTSWE